MGEKNFLLKSLGSLFAKLGFEARNPALKREILDSVKAILVHCAHRLLSESALILCKRRIIFTVHRPLQ
jgi:hypothetical protein